MFFLNPENVHTKRFRNISIIPLFIVAALFFITPHTASADGLCDWPHLKSDLPPDQGITYGCLENGFRYILMENKEPRKRVSMHLYVPAGSFDENDKQQGLAHFLEHMLFEGSTHFKPGEMVKYFQKIGMQFGPDVNAHTNFFETVYDIFLPDGGKETLDEGLLIMQDYAMGALLLPSEIDQERDIILAEKRTRDSVSYRTFEKTIKWELPDARVSKRLPIGDENVIKNADQALLKDFYDTWYRPDDLILVVVGDFKTRVLEERINAFFKDFKERAEKRLEPDFGDIHFNGMRAFYHYEPEAGNTDVTIQILDKKPLHADTFLREKDELFKDMAGRILNHRLDKIMEKPDAPFTSASTGAGVYLKQVGYAYISAECLPDKWRGSLNTLEKVLRQALTYGVTEEEVERVKAEFLSDLKNEAEKAETRDSTDIARAIMNDLGDGEVFMSPKDELRLFSPVVDSFTAQIAQDALKNAWNAEHVMVLVTGNAKIEENGKAPENILLAEYQKSLETDIAKPVAQERVTFPYLPKPENPGKIANKTIVDDLGVTLIDFENGLRLNMKPTDFKKNEILFALDFGPGEKAEPADKPGLSELSEAVINESGLGRIEKEDLKRALAGKQTSISFQIDEDNFSFAGQTVPNEIELMFQLLQAQLNDPSFREKSFEFVMKRFKQMYEAMNKNIDASMELHVNPFLAGGDFRFGLPDEAAFFRLSLDDVRKYIENSILTNRLELSIVGDFDPGVVERLAAEYLGSMPNRTDAAGNSRVRPVDFTNDKEETFEIDTRIDKGLSITAYPTDDFWDIGRTRRLSLLSQIFSDRMRESIREKLGATYSPYAYNAPSRAYSGYGVFKAVVSINPQDAGIVTNEIFKIADDIREKGVTEDEFERAVKPIVNKIKDMRRTNSYWLSSVLENVLRYPEQLDWSRSMVSDYESIRPEELKKLAETYLQNGNAAILTVVPKK